MIYLEQHFVRESENTKSHRSALQRQRQWALSLTNRGFICLQCFQTFVYGIIIIHEVSSLNHKKIIELTPVYRESKLLYSHCRLLSYCPIIVERWLTTSCKNFFNRNFVEWSIFINDIMPLRSNQTIISFLSYYTSLVRINNAWWVGVFVESI